VTKLELQAIAKDLVPPHNSSGVIVTVEHQPGQKLPTGQPSGIGGTTRYRVAFTDGIKAFPVGPAFERAKDAFRLVDILS
jgi:hypothetical protein